MTQKRERLNKEGVMRHIHQGTWCRRGALIGLLLVGANPVQAMEQPERFVVAESAEPRERPFLEELIGPEPGSQNQPERRSSLLPKSPLPDHSLAAPLVVRPSGRVNPGAFWLREELMIREPLVRDANTGSPLLLKTLDDAERSIEVPLAFPAPFIFDPARGILVFDVLTLTPTETHVFASSLVTSGEPPSRPLPSVDEAGPSITSAPDSVAGLLSFMKSFAPTPELGSVAVIVPALAALGLLHRLRSDKAVPDRKREKPRSSVASAGASAGHPAPDEKAPSGPIMPECTEKLPAVRSAA
jgi:hypothetical protein